LKERLITLGLALGALVMVYILFLPKPMSPDAAPARPLSTGSRPDGYQVIWRWLQSNHLDTAAWRDRYDQLTGRFGQAQGGHVLIATLPYDTAVSPREMKSLREWIRDGNTLLVTAALNDTPVWASTSSSDLVDEVWRLTGMAVSAIQSDEPHDKQDKAQELRNAVVAIMADRTSTVMSRGAHPLMQGVHVLKITSALPSSRWQLKQTDGIGVLHVANVEGRDEGVVWLRREGAGQIILIAYAGIFSNGNITAGDNGQLLSNVLAWSLRPGGTVLFDDAHQGAVSYYDAKAFFADPRLHRTLGWLVLLWLVFVLGIQRLRTHSLDWRPIDITAFIGISGEFLASATTPVAAASRLMANFFNSIRRRLDLREDGTPEWDWLAAQPNVKAAEVKSLAGWYSRVHAGKPVDLMKLQAFLRLLQEKIV
jgi:Domain of unknown function (DUF4350)